MKSIPKTIRLSRDEIQKQVAKEFDCRYAEVQRDIQGSVARQTMLIVLYMLENVRGYGKVRLKRFIDDVNSACENMDGVGFAKGFTTDDLKSHFLEIGIDLDEEIKVYFEDRK